MRTIVGIIVMLIFLVVGIGLMLLGYILENNEDDIRDLVKSKLRKWKDKDDYKKK